MISGHSSSSCRVSDCGRSASVGWNRGKVNKLTKWGGMHDGHSCSAVQSHPSSELSTRSHEIWNFMVIH